MCNRCIASPAPPDAQRLSRLRRFSLLARRKLGVGRFCPAGVQRHSRLRRFPLLARGKSGVGSFYPADAQLISYRKPCAGRACKLSLPVRPGSAWFCPADAQRFSRLRRFPFLARGKSGVGSFCPADAQLISCRRPCAGRASKLSLGALTEKKQMVYNNVYDSSDFERMQRKLWELQGK